MTEGADVLKPGPGKGLSQEGFDKLMDRVSQRQTELAGASGSRNPLRAVTGLFRRGPSEPKEIRSTEEIVPAAEIIVPPTNTSDGGTEGDSSEVSAVEAKEEKIDTSPYAEPRKKLEQIISRIEEYGIKRNDAASRRSSFTPGISLEEAAEAFRQDYQDFQNFRVADEPRADKMHIVGDAVNLEEEIVSTLIDSRFEPQNQELLRVMNRLKVDVVGTDVKRIVDRYRSRIRSMIDEPSLRSAFTNPVDARWLNANREELKYLGKEEWVEYIHGEDDEWQRWMEEANQNTPENRERMLQQQQQAEGQRMKQEIEEKRFQEFEQDLRTGRVNLEQLPQKLIDFGMQPGDRVHELIKNHPMSFNQYTSVMNQFFALIKQESK